MPFRTSTVRTSHLQDAAARDAARISPRAHAWNAGAKREAFPGIAK